MLNDTLIGKQLDEYLIDKAVGAGGMAHVYRALDTKLQRYVALKVIAPDLRAQSDYHVRFEREAQSIARLDHPNIVHIYRVGEADDLYYMAMQYIEGADLGWLIEDYRNDGELMTTSDVLRIVRDIGAALDYAHSKNVIHRDVKPGNIIIDKLGHAILTDFGLALLGDIGTQGEILGSPYYIAPEQATGSGKATPQSDLYALGVTLFEMLTGELPFVGSKPMDVAMRHVSEAPPVPSSINRAIPRAVDQVVLHSLEKSPEKRYQTGAEFSNALQQALASWLPESLPEPSMRTSLIMVPQKVDSRLKESPLPLPPTPAIQPDRVQAPAIAIPPAPAILPSLTTTMVAGSAAPTQNIPPRYTSGPTYETAPAGRPIWLYPALLAIVLLCTGATCLAGLLIVARNATSSGVNRLPTAILTQTPGPTEAATETLLPTPTQLPLEPSVTPLIFAPGENPGEQPSQLPPSILLPPPDNRNSVPTNSFRLGEFAVEGYCNNRGYGVKIVDNNDWACTNNADNSVIFILQPSDFDNICRARYNRQSAFAILDQQKEVRAYNWSCYDYLTSR
jgi:serine/threonine protein kinase